MKKRKRTKMPRINERGNSRDRQRLLDTRAPALPPGQATAPQVEAKHAGSRGRAEPSCAALGGHGRRQTAPPRAPRKGTHPTTPQRPLKLRRTAAREPEQRQWGKQKQRKKPPPPPG